MSVLLGAAGPTGSLIYQSLMARATGKGNDHVLACMIASWQQGEGLMPDWLGLSNAVFHCLMEHHFSGVGTDAFVLQHRESPENCTEEIKDLVRLMLADRAGDCPSEVWMAQVVATGSMAPEHLWRNLGLWSRSHLTELLHRNFPALAQRNVKDMKWKRFLYKRLCEAEGFHACAAPRCEVCSDYDMCFGPED